MVVANDHSGQSTTPVVADPDFIGFDDAIADGQNQAVLVDDHTGTLALCAQRRRAARIGQRPGLDFHDRTKEFFGVDACLHIVGGSPVSGDRGQGNRKTRGNQPCRDTPPRPRARSNHDDLWGKKRSLMIFRLWRARATAATIAPATFDSRASRPVPPRYNALDTPL